MSFCLTVANSSMGNTHTNLMPRCVFLIDWFKKLSLLPILLTLQMACHVTVLFFKMDLVVLLVMVLFVQH
jgi:hypothetical protein